MRNVKRVTGGHKTSQNVCASAAFSAWLRSSSAFFTCQDLGSSAWFTESVAFASAVSCSKLSAPGDPSLRASGSSPRVLLKRIGLHLAKCGHGWPWLKLLGVKLCEIMKLICIDSTQVRLGSILFNRRIRLSRWTAISQGSPMSTGRIPIVIYII